MHATTSPSQCTTQCTSRLLRGCLQAAFPLKFSDPEWGVWARAFFVLCTLFGLYNYMGHNGKDTGTVLRVGGRHRPHPVVPALAPGDVHLPADQRLKVFWGGIQWRRRIFDVSMMVCLASGPRELCRSHSPLSFSLSPTETLLPFLTSFRH